MEKHLKYNLMLIQNTLDKCIKDDYLSDDDVNDFIELSKRLLKQFNKYPQ